MVEDIRVPAFFSQVLTQDTAQTVVGAVATTTDMEADANIDVTSTVNGLVVEDLWDNSAKTTDNTYTGTGEDPGCLFISIFYFFFGGGGGGAQNMCGLARAGTHT